MAAHAPTYDLFADSPARDDHVIQEATAILHRRLSGRALITPDTHFTAPADVKAYLTLQLAELEHEVFGVMFLTSQHHLIKWEVMFRGTINSASVYPREVLKAALACNAAAVIFAHNHPSGDVAAPSEADRKITTRLKEALALIDVRALDHVIISGGNLPYSFAEKGDM